MRVVGWIAALLVVIWMVAHLLYLGPIRDATEAALAVGVWLVCASGLVAALAVLAFGLVAVGSSAAWLRFVAGPPAGAARVGPPPNGARPLPLPLPPPRAQHPPVLLRPG